MKLIFITRLLNMNYTLLETPIVNFFGARRREGDKPAAREPAGHPGASRGEHQPVPLISKHARHARDVLTMSEHAHRSLT